MDQLLIEYRSEDGMVDYERLKENKDDVNAVIELLQSADLADMSDTERKAFLVNAYNFLVIDGIINGDIESSVKDDSKFFVVNRFKLGEDSSSLDDLENDQLRSVYNDPRIHFALNCGALSCPPLNAESFKGDEIELQLERLTKEAVNDSLYVYLNEKERVIQLSPIFDWFIDDFDAEGGVIPFINKYRSNPLPDSLSIIYNEYDWSLNSN